MRAAAARRTPPKISRKVTNVTRSKHWKEYSRKCRRVVYINKKTDAFGLIDGQPTFMPEHSSGGRVIPAGGLPVSFGHLIIPVVLGVAMYFALLFASRDRHKNGGISLASSYVGIPVYTVLTYKTVKHWTAKNHKIAPHAKFSLEWLKTYLKLAKYQTLWPDHGMVGTEEAEIHPELRGLPYFLVQDKGLDYLFDSYSAVKDNFERSTGLSGKLHKRGILRVFLGGLAFDYCVGYTALGLVEEGFEVYIIRDATRSVARKSELVMLRKLRKAGVVVINSNQLRHAA